jgi:deazaflavin-dependent oxidoreductase (nitroreductase family)
MAKQFRNTRVRRILNKLMTRMIRRGKGPPGVWLVTVPGRRSGQPHSTPVSPVEEGGERWLVSPYGVVGWVRNLRAAGRATLEHRGRSEEVVVVEVGPEEAAPVLRSYVAGNRIARRYFDARPDDPPEAFVAEAGRHPVFRVVADGG